MTTVDELEAAGAKLPTALTDAATKLKGAISVTATADTYTVVGYRSCTTGGETSCKTGDVW